MSQCFPYPFLLFRTFGLSVELRPSLASLANGGGVDDRRELLRTMLSDVTSWHSDPFDLNKPSRCWREDGRKGGRWCYEEQRGTGTSQYWSSSSRGYRGLGAIVSPTVNSLQACQEFQPTSLHLVFVAVNARRSETVSSEVLPGLVLVGSAVVTPAQKVSNEAKKVISLRLLTARGEHGGSRGCGGRAVSWR